MNTLPSLMTPHTHRYRTETRPNPKALLAKKHTRGPHWRVLSSLAIWLACTAFAISNAVSAPNSPMPAFFSGIDLLNQCESEGAEYLICLGYVSGVVDATATGTNQYQMMSDSLSQRTSDELNQSLSKSLVNLMPAPCIPREVLMDQVVRVVIKHMNNRPEDLHLSGAHLVHEALQKAFPC